MFTVAYSQSALRPPAPLYLWIPQHYKYAVIILIARLHFSESVRPLWSFFLVLRRSSTDIRESFPHEMSLAPIEALMCRFYGSAP